MSTLVSILIPTHNRSAVLLRTLESLRAMDLPPQFTDRLEVVIVANACTDQTVADVARVSQTMPFPVRCVEEPAVGANPARNRAIAEARGEIFAFLDDDVWVEKAWLTGLLEVFDSQPADLIAGTVNLWWEVVRRPEWMDTRSEHLLSCVNYGHDIIELFKPGQAVGANMAFRRRVVDKVGGFTIGLDRIGDVPLSGGDTDFLARALDAGFRMFYAPRAVVKHWVAPRRISIEYLSAVAYGNGLARAFLRKDFSSWTAFRLIVEHCFRVFAYFMMEPVFRIVGHKKAYIHERIRRKTSRGNIIGTWRRWLGRTPSGDRPKPP